MKILLDTHVFLWWIDDDARLSEVARRLITDSANELLLSAASAWEIVIKHGKGNISLPSAPEAFIAQHMRSNRINELAISIAHALRFAALPNHHRDPFDRLLVAQADYESLPVLTIDPEISRYPIKTLW